MSKTPKLCIDCRHYRSDGACLRTAKGKSNNAYALVGNPPEPAAHYTAWYHRYDGWLESILDNTCGSRGRWWEPKEEPVVVGSHAIQRDPITGKVVVKSV